MLVRGLLRTLLLWSIVGMFVLQSLLGVVVHRDLAVRRRFTVNRSTRTARRLLRALGFHITIKGAEHIPSAGKALIVANHVSYLDVPLMAHVFQALFITSVDVKNTLFLGFISEMAGSIFVDRRNKAAIHRDIDQVAEVMRAGMPIILFAEGTSSNGDSVLPFKASLFAVAEQTGVEVLPVCITYQRINAQPITPGNRDRLYYYGDLYFFPHIVRLPFLNSIDVMLEILPPIKHSGLGRKQLCQECYSRIAAAHSAASVAV